MFFLKKNKSFVVLSAALLLCWGMAIPIKENMSAWLAKEGVQTMLRINSGIYSPDDAAKLENYIARNNSDLAAAYAYLLVLRRAGKLSEAEELLRSLRAAGFNVDKINLQQALIYFLTDRTDKAEQIFKDLLASGKSSAGILFNYSKIKFDLLDTEGSRDLFDQANKQDPVLMEQMQQREDLSGIKSPLSFAELGLSIGDVFSMSYNSNFDTEKTYNLNMLTVFQNLKTLNFAAILSLIISLIIPQSKMRRGKLNSEAFSSYRHSPVLYQTLRLIPGGSFALNGRPLAATFLCSLIALFLMPLLGWPQTTAYFLSSLKWAKIYYVYFVCFFIGSCCYIGFFDFEEDKI